MSRILGHAFAAYALAVATRGGWYRLPASLWGFPIVWVNENAPYPPLRTDEELRLEFGRQYGRPTTGRVTILP